jgi:hypothetical protein
MQTFANNAPAYIRKLTLHQMILEVKYADMSVANLYFFCEFKMFCADKIVV